MRTLVPALLAVPLLAILPTTAAHAASTCQSLPATIEAASGTVNGTPGDDVILVTGPATVSALGGNDTICVAGGTLDAGQGNDSVLVNSGSTEKANLGTGDDSYSSVGNNSDEVDLARNGGDSAGKDTISTGGGFDDVYSGVPGVPNLDSVDLGADYDGFHVVLPTGSDVHAVGGPAGDTSTITLSVDEPAGQGAPLTVQLPLSFSRAGASLGSFSGFTYPFITAGPTTPVVVRGTDGNDTVIVQGGVPDIDLGGGKDYVSLWYVDDLSGSIDGGAGRGDALEAFSDGGTMTADAGRSRFDHASMTGFDTYFLGADRLSFTGNERRDTVYGMGCKVTLNGGAGNDYLSYAPDDLRQVLPDCAHRFTMRGQAGNDRMTGWKGRDKLYGGPGRDAANGKQNIDVCVAESESNCER